MSTLTVRRPARTLALAAAGSLCAAALAACGSNGASSTTATAPDSTPMSSMPMSPHDSMGSGMTGMHGMKGMVMIEDFAFTSPKSVAPGATVMVMNMDSEAHSVTADSGDAFDVTVPPGRTAEITAPDKPGSYPFHCMFHSNMHGTLRVR